ncbi:MAG: serine protein kinase RIO [Bradymonadaceae bacterium]|nr:serine protein kinase RIO [Lujinxingiaceae bacterium]
MRIPPRLVPLIEYGIIQSVVRPLLSGKEAQVYLVESGGELRAAKVYKSVQERSFRNRSSYTEGRQVRNTRDQRAMGKHSRYGREQEEAAWNSIEVDTIYKLDAAGVRVPKPFAFVDGVLVMECIGGSDGGVALRISDCHLDKEQGLVVCDQILAEVVKMLCADVVHADLSVYNVLLEERGPVIIDFPQSIGASKNPHARKILLRDVANITSFFRFGRAPEELRYGYEMWDLYERGQLAPDTVLTGKFDIPEHLVDADILLLEMQQIEEDEALAEFGEDLDFDS